MVILFTMACRKKEPPKLNTKDLVLIDSLFNERKDSLYLLGDSLCEVRYDKLFSEVKDSIKKRRLKDIEEILGLQQ